MRSIDLARDHAVGRPDTRAMTFAETIICVVILSYMASMAIPLAENARRREQELELRESLRTIRRAIDTYHEMTLSGKAGLDPREGYPRTLEALVDARLLREVPVSPFTGRDDWVRISTTDARARASGAATDGHNVFDVRTPQMGRTLDDVDYADL